MKKRAQPKPISLARELSALQEWLPRNAARIRDGGWKMVDEALAPGADRKSLLIASGRLQQLWAWYADEGGAAVLRGDDGGWAVMARGLGYGIARVAIAVRSFEVNRNPVVLGNSVALMLAHAMAVGDDAAADWLAARLEASVASGVFGKWLELNAFEPFIVQLHGRRVGRAIDFAVAPRYVAPYDAVSKAWTAGDEPLRQALVAICEHHLASVEDTSTWTAEFGTSIYRVWPAEVLAIANTRARLGLSTPAINHPLMQTPLATPPPAVPPAHIDDERVQALVARARDLLGDISLPR